MSLSELQRKHLGLAVEFIANGVPVFVAKPVPKSWDGRSEFFFPPGWPYIEANPKHLEDWRPGWAVCAVTGVKFDVVDIDPRHGGDNIYLDMRAADLLPPHLGYVKTPSGGFHVYTNRSFLRKFTPWEGVDLQAGDRGGNGRGFVYIPPTVRKGKPYLITQSIQWDQLANTESDYLKFFDVLLKKYDFKPRERATYKAMQREPVEYTEYEQQEVIERANALARVVAKAKVGNRDTLLNKYSYTLGGMVSGSGLDEQYAVNILAVAASMWSIPQVELTNWVYPKISRGVEQGKLYPIDIFAFEEDAFGKANCGPDTR